VSQLAVGSAIEMQSAYKAPASPPTAQITWPLTPLASDVFPTGKRGLFWDATTSHWFYAVANGVGFDSTIEEVTTAGVSVASYPIKQVGGTLPIDANGGVVKIGTTWYVLGRDHLGDYQVFRFTSLTAAVNNNAAGNWAYTNDPLGLRPALGTDGTDIIIARTNGSDNVVVRHFGPTTGTNSLTVTSSNTPGNRNLAGVLLLGTSAGFAANRYVVAPVDSGTLQGAAEGNILVYTTGGTYQSDDVFPVAYGATLAGLGWNGTDIIQLSIGTEENSTGKLARYLTGNNWTTQSARYEVSFTRRDGVGTAHETNDSPVTVITMKKRARLRVSCAAGLLSSPGVDDPDRVRIYIGRGSGGSVTDATRWRQTEPAAGITTVDLDAIVFSGNNLTARDAAFGDSTHAELRTSDGIPLLRANGTVRCRLVKGTVSTANNTDASVGWDSEDIDTDNFWSSGAASVITVPYSGQYHVAFHGVWAANGTGRRALFMESSSDGGANWSLMPALQDRRMAVGGGDVTINEISQIASLVTGNQYRVRRNQDSTAALNLNQARFSIEFKGPS